MQIPKHIEHWDDERASGNGIIVTLQWGWSFEPSHEGVCGFDTVTEARRATAKKNLFRCGCTQCRINTVAKINIEESA